jgi:hypothetical protein
MDKYKMKVDKTLNLCLTHSHHKCRVQNVGLGNMMMTSSEGHKTPYKKTQLDLLEIIKQKLEPFLL